MATGYTYCIRDGISFKDFVLKCARAFGACINQKDNPSNEPIKMENEESIYYITRLNELQAEYNEFMMLTDKQLRNKFVKYVDEGIFRTQESIEEKNDLKKKYEKMLDEIRKWTPPTTEHVSLKEFMISQITESIEWDCDLEYDNKSISHYKNLTFEEWKSDTKKSLIRDIEFAAKHLNEDLTKIRDRNKWKEQLIESLK